jgi:hypothetical protein
VSKNLRRLDIGGDASGQITVGDNNISIMNQAETVDIEKLVKFATAVKKALPVLDLEEDEQRSAEGYTVEILGSAKEPAPDHGRLRQIGRSLRTILEGAAGNALASGLLGMWSP